MDIPQDPIILVSYVNTKLRDQFATLDEFCRTYDINEEELRDTLDSIDYQYDETTGEISRNEAYEGLNALFVLPMEE